MAASSTRLGTLRDLLWRPWSWVVALIYAIAGGLQFVDQTVKPRVFSAYWQVVWDSYYKLPSWQWKTYALVGVTILLLSTIEGAYRAIRGKQHQINELTGTADEIVAADSNLRLKSSEIITVDRNAEGFIIESDGDMAVDRVVAVEVKNERLDMRSVGSAKSVTGSITYRSVFENQAIVESGDGLWVSEESAAVKLLPNGKHQLVVALIRGSGNDQQFFALERTIGVLRSRRVKETKLAGKLIHVSVRLNCPNQTIVARGEYILGDPGLPLYSLVLWKGTQLMKLQLEGYQMMAAYRECRREGIDDLRYAWIRRVEGFLDRFYPADKKRFLDAGLTVRISGGLMSLRRQRPSMPRRFDDEVYDQVKVLDGIYHRG